MYYGLHTSYNIPCHENCLFLVVTVVYYEGNAWTKEDLILCILIKCFRYMDIIYRLLILTAYAYKRVI